MKQHILYRTQRKDRMKWVRNPYENSFQVSQLRMYCIDEGPLREPRNRL